MCELLVWICKVNVFFEAILAPKSYFKIITAAKNETIKEIDIK